MIHKHQIQVRVLAFSKKERELNKQTTNYECELNTGHGERLKDRTHEGAGRGEGMYVSLSHPAATFPIPRGSSMHWQFFASSANFDS